MNIQAKTRNSIIIAGILLSVVIVWMLLPFSGAMILTTYNVEGNEYTILENTFAAFAGGLAITHPWERIPIEYMQAKVVKPSGDTEICKFLPKGFEALFAGFVFLFLESGLFDLELHRPTSDFIEFVGHGIDFGPDHRAGFIHKIYCLIGQEPV